MAKLKAQGAPSANSIEGQNVGTSERGDTFAPTYNMSMRAVNRFPMNGKRKRNPIDDINAKEASRLSGDMSD